ncbi:hypothetical protein BH23VER1_BH23VER1_18370 [soil metagenome]
MLLPRLRIPLVFRLLAALALAGALAGCSAIRYRDAPKFDPRMEGAEMKSIKLAMRATSVSTPASASPTVGVGDVLQVAMVGVPDSAAQCVVLPDGLIYYDMAGGIPVEGLTVSQVEARVASHLAATGEYADPTVTVDLASIRSQKFTVLGQVGTPGSYPVQAPVTLLDALAGAGGVTDAADLGRSMVVRGNDTVPADVEALIQRGDMSQNIYLRPNDYVFIPMEGIDRVHVLGSVNSPTSVPYTGKLAIVAALASAGGPSRDAAAGTVAVVRGSLQAPRVAVFDFKDIMTGKASNFQLLPDDIIWVPRSPWATVEEYVLLAFRSSASALAIRAADEVFLDDGDSRRRSGGTSVSVPQSSP